MDTSFIVKSIKPMVILDKKVPTLVIHVTGKENTGKTTWIKKLMYGTFEKRYIATVYINVYKLILETSKGNICLSLWDFAGQDKYKMKSLQLEADGYLNFQNEEPSYRIDGNTCFIKSKTELEGKTSLEIAEPLIQLVKDLMKDIDFLKKAIDKITKFNIWLKEQSLD